MLVAETPEIVGEFVLEITHIVKVWMRPLYCTNWCTNCVV